jgi:hypothetical protein
MKGHDRLIEHRKLGKPVAGVWVCHSEDKTDGWRTWDKYRGFDLYPEVQISQTEVPSLLDLRFAVGLVVHVSGCKNYAKAKRLHQAFVEAKAKRVLTVSGGTLIDSELGEYDGYVPE